MLKQVLRTGWSWPIPSPSFNMGVATSDVHVAAGAGNKVALELLNPDSPTDSPTSFTFSQLSSWSSSLSVALQLGPPHVSKGDAVAVLLPQSLEAALSHLAIYKAGGIAVPLFVLFGPEALEYRLSASGATTVITDAEHAPIIAELAPSLPSLKSIIVTDLGSPQTQPLLPSSTHLDSVLPFWETLSSTTVPSSWSPVETAPEDPALLIFTSGTTGPPKGALHSHQVLLGHLPGVELPHEWFPHEADKMWTPADWAWIGGLLDVLLPSLYHGVPVVAYRAKKFDPELAFRIMGAHKIRNVFMPPTALKLMRQVDNPAGQGWNYALRTIGTGGETLGESMLEWGREVFHGRNIHEFYGQTEANLIVGNCSSLFPVRPGSMGQAIPGHKVAILRADGSVADPGEVGDIAVAAPDPVMFLGYLNNPEATKAKFSGEWMKTGDQGHVDEDGYFWFFGRSDDVITSAGYRIGPGEIEDCLMKHPAVLNAAAVGIPDPVRTEAIRAYVVLSKSFSPSPELELELADFVRSHLAAHEAPRSVRFTESLPMTTTGKVMRKVLREQAIESGDV